MGAVALPAAGLNVSRFLHAQSGRYPRIVREIRTGVKRTHWMWFVFPQLHALGKSDTARYYGIADRDEALAYLENPVLRLRLGECTAMVLKHQGLMFAHPDNHKLRSSMTLFSQVVDDPTLPNAVLAKFFDGKPDQLTLDVLAGKEIILPSPRREEATGRRKQTALRLPAETEPWSRARVKAFVSTFGLGALGTDQMVDAWLADRGRAMGAAWASMEEQYGE